MKRRCPDPDWQPLATLLPRALAHVGPLVPCRFASGPSFNPATHQISGGTFLSPESEVAETKFACPQVPQTPRQIEINQILFAIPVTGLSAVPTVSCWASRLLPPLLRASSSAEVVTVPSAE